MLFEDCCTLTAGENADTSTLPNKTRPREGLSIIFNEGSRGRHEIFATAFTNLHHYGFEMDPVLPPSTRYPYKVAHIFYHGNQFSEQRNIAADIIMTYFTKLHGPSATNTNTFRPSFIPSSTTLPPVSSTNSIATAAQALPTIASPGSTNYHTPPLSLKQTQISITILIHNTVEVFKLLNYLLICLIIGTTISTQLRNIMHQCKELCMIYY